MIKLNIIKIKYLKLSFLLLAFALSGNTQVFGVTIDNILSTIFYTQNDSSYIILHESVYHPTVGKYEQGNIRSQGYNSSRISVYSLDDGHLVAQKNMGIMDSTEACFILGCSLNNLWIYCNKFKSGIQSFYPLTLEKHISQAKIYKSLNISVGRFSEPKWHIINEYYGFDAIQQKLIVTNTDNQQFYIDVKTFATQPITNKINLKQQHNSYLEESVVFNDSVWELAGYEQMKFKCGNLIVSNSSFLYGKFIIEQNSVRLFKHFFNVQEKLISEKAKLEDLSNLVSLKTIDLRVQNSKDNIENLIKGTKPDEVLMQPDDNSFFVMSKSALKPEATINITKISSQKFGNFNEEWSTILSGMFYNVAQARNTKAFKQYFGDIFPEFDYQFFQLYDNKLVVIYLLHISCIDINSGNIIWQFKLR